MWCLILMAGGISGHMLFSVVNIDDPPSGISFNTHDGSMGRWYTFTYTFTIKSWPFIKVADLSPIHSRKLSATDGTYGSKYWWNQGLALIQGQIYNPVHLGKYTIVLRIRHGTSLTSVLNWNHLTRSHRRWKGHVRVTKRTAKESQSYLVLRMLRMFNVDIFLLLIWWTHIVNLYILTYFDWIHLIMRCPSKSFQKVGNVEIYKLKS